MAARWRVRDALLALPAAATKTGDTGFGALPLAMLRLLVVYAAVVLCAFPGAAALARSSASDTGSRLPECVLFLRCSCKLCC